MTMCQPAMWGVVVIMAACHGSGIASPMQSIQPYKDHCRLTDDKLVCKGYRGDSLDMEHIAPLENYEVDATGIRHLEVKNGFTPVINSQAFATMKGLINLAVRNMSVSKLDLYAFEGLSQIKSLDLSHNNIRFFHASTFKTLNVRNIKLDGNPSLEIPTNSPLINAPKLQGLSLRHCNIEHLPGVAFQGTPFLSHLDLSRNRLELLPAILFENTTLTWLDLSHNNFRTLSLEVFQLVPHFPTQPRAVILAGNPWHCDCKQLGPVARWLTQDIKSSSVTISPAHSRLQMRTICASPENSIYQSWNEEHLWKC